jgi:tetratricopeptide (TPR) repeat protein
MKKFSATRLAVALLVCASAQCARAQAQGAKGDAVVRERRVTKTAGATQTAPESRKEAGGASSEKTEKTARPASTPDGQPSSTPDARPATKGAAPEKAAEGDGADEAGAKSASASSAAERARARLAVAEQLAESGQRAEAVALLRSLLAEDRFDPPLFYNTGNALARLGESNAAVEAYRKAIAQRRGNYSRAQHNLGVVLMRLGRWDEAEEALKAALRLENYTYAEASYSLGRLYALRGDAGLAIAEWQRTLRLKPDHADAAVALARTLAEDGDPGRGLAVLDAFAARASRRGADVPREVTVARGEIVAATDAAAERHEKSLPEAKESGPSVRAASEARGAEEERNAKEVRGADASRDDTPRKDAAASASSATPSSSSPADKNSLAVLREARAPSKPLRPLVVGREAYALLMDAREARADNRTSEAAALYRRAIQANDGYFAPANIELGYTLMSMRRNQEAVTSLLVVVRKEGARYPVTFYHLGRLYEQLGRTDEAGESFKRAAELMGDTSPQFYIDLSRVRERQGRYAEALAAAEQYVQLMSRAGEPPEWATRRVGDLRKKIGQGAASPAKN